VDDGALPVTYEGCLNRCKPTTNQRWSSTDDSAPSEARKRGSGGGSPRKYDHLLTGPSDLDLHQMPLTIELVIETHSLLNFFVFFLAFFLAFFLFLLPCKTTYEGACGWSRSSIGSLDDYLCQRSVFSKHSLNVVTLERTPHHVRSPSEYNIRQNEIPEPMRGVLGGEMSLAELLVLC
jgi:hypothetical protein